MGRPLPASQETMLDAAPVRPVLEQLVRERQGADPLVGIRVEPVQRGVVRFVAELASGRTWPVIGKYYDDLADCGFDRWRRLWDEGFDPRTSPGAGEPSSTRIPEPYAFVPELTLMLMEEAPGGPLKSLIKKRRARAGAGTGTGPMHAFGEALVRLHRWPLAGETPFTVDDHVARRCRPGPAALVDAYPDLRGVVDDIIGTAARLDAAWLAEGELAWTHGDCHLGQMHVSGDELWMLDLDPMQPAHPAYDVAMVLTAIDRLVTPKKSDDLAARRDEFLAAYFARSPWAIAARLPLYQALILLKQAFKRFRWQDEPGWEQAVPALVHRAASCLSVLDERPAPKSVAEVVALDVRGRG